MNKLFCMECRNSSKVYKSLLIYHPKKFLSSFNTFNANLKSSQKHQFGNYIEFHKAQGLLKNTFFFSVKRFFKSDGSKVSGKQTTLLYLSALVIITAGLSYAAVPLYRIYCQASGYGGSVKHADTGEQIENMKRVADRKLIIRFEASTGNQLQWSFKPQQKEVQLTPGETALAFYTAKNLSDRPIIGIATYNVVPFSAGQYFNKIQCFCFEEQQLNPREEVDMPVFFYIDPEIDEDPLMEKVKEIILSYTFFESTGNISLPSPHHTR
ncbi:cytochrome c oxidase assembly protein COX11, mitochondrial isoform X1 [Hydra vulgaris]|uniref:Cytochrome c oxidase assembly protein COX11, mitochondrial isoform X1 n=1 Tax=Hydra vulgaris TaxID=6087 RepID=A0ABM4CCW0_HYDVU